MGPLQGDPGGDRAWGVCGAWGAERTQHLWLQFPGRGCGPERARRLSVHIRHARFPGTATPTRPHTSGATFPLTGRVGAENEQRTACKPSSVHYVSLRRKDLPVPG